MNIVNKVYFCYNLCTFSIIKADERTNINEKNGRTDENGRTDGQTDTYTYAYDV